MRSRPTARAPQTRREQLDALRAAFGFAMFAPEHQRELLTWLLPVALGTADAMAIAATLMDELRRRKILAPGPSVIERLVAVASMLAERQVAHQLTRDLLPAQAKALDALLTIKEGTAMSALAWARQPPGAPGHRALARLVEQRAILSAIALDPACAEGVHPERLRKLAREGARFTAQHLRALSPLRRRAILVATVLDTITRLTDDTVALFDRAVGRMFRRAEIREQRCPDARCPGDQRQGAPAGKAGSGVDRGSGERRRFAGSRGFRDRLGQAGPQRRGGETPGASGQNGSSGPGRARLAGAASARAAVPWIPALSRRSGGRRDPARGRASALDLRERRPEMAAQPADELSPSGLARSGVGAETANRRRRIWEAATLLALRDRLRAGDIWVEGSRQWRAVEDQLIPPALFAAMREAGPLPRRGPGTAEEYLAERRALLERRLAEVSAKAAADQLEDVRINGNELKITPLKAVTPEEAETLADRLYAMMPNLRITSLLAEVDRWTGFSGAFTHLHSGAPADDRRVVLTAVLADATNLGLTRMAEACSVASYRQLAWTAAWHLREETYRRALAILVNAQQRQPLAALFGAADVSSSDGQHFPTAGRGEAVGAVNAHYGRTASALFYTHLSARQAPYHTVAIPPSGEAAYVIDGLLYHEADLSIAHPPHRWRRRQRSRLRLGVPLGFYFAPRIPNLAERRLYTLGPTERLASARTVHRRAHRRKADHGALG